MKITYTTGRDVTQFETIHPFTDGNGRVGRALLHAVLRAKELTRQVTVPVSAGLLVNTERYFGTLLCYQQGDPEPLIRQLAKASFAAIGNGRRLVSDLHQLRSSWDEQIRARKGAAAWRLADVVIRQPAIDSPLAARALGDVPASTALRAIDMLVDAGVLTKASGHQRYQRWTAPQVLSALDAFAERAGQRGQPSGH